MSQFWYDEATAAALAAACRTASGGGRIACVSAPTLYIALKKLYGENCKVRLFEHDKRFARYNSFSLQFLFQLATREKKSFFRPIGLYKVG